ncbi:hypothetical protein [Oricola cellulosilytica]|nr:hypothetical protein [Oricola cellulosilytica]
MDEKIEKSCWGTAAWAVAGFAVVMVVVYLTGMSGGEGVATSMVTK